MSERLTKEREAEIRAYYSGEAQPSYHVPPEPGDYALADVRDLLAEIDALRDTLRDREAQRMVAIAMAEYRKTRLARLRDAAVATERLFSYSDSMQQFVLPTNTRVIPALGALRAALAEIDAPRDGTKR